MSSEASPLINRLEQKQLQQQKLYREVVLVAGGTGLLGLGIVKALLCRNALVVVPSRSQDQLDTLVREVARIRDVGQPPTPVAERRAEGRVYTRERVEHEEPEEKEQQHQPQHGSPRPPYLQPPLSLSAETTSSRDLGRLFTILADVGDPKGAAYIRETILERFGRLDRVIATMSRFWGKGVTTEQSYEEWDTALRNIVGVHFVCVKEFLPVLKANGRGSYTFVTGRGGEVCICPEMGLMTVGTCALFGLVEAVKEEAKRGYPGVTINEVRLGLRVVGEGEEIERAKEIYGEHTCTNATYVGKAIAAIALSSTTRTDHPPFYLYSLQEVDEVLRNLWSFHKRQPARGKGDVDRDKETINQENENRQQEILT